MRVFKLKKEKIENLNKFPMISLSSPYVYKE